MEDINSKVARTIRRTREMKGFSQEYLSFQLGIPQNTYSRLENGKTKITVEKVFAIGHALQHPVQDLLGLAAAEKTPPEATITESEKELYRLTIAAKDTLIRTLQEQVAMLKQR